MRAEGCVIHQAFIAGDNQRYHPLWWQKGKLVAL